MKAYVTSIGERTTELCCWQLKRLGFEVILLDRKESWPDKYRTFISLATAANEPCIRLDADVIVNKNLKTFVERELPQWAKHIWLIQFHTYDFYKNEIGITSPVYYAPEALAAICKNLYKLDPRRPEASAWRLPEVNEEHNATFPDPYETGTIEVMFKEVVGMHGFFQDDDAIARTMENKLLRKQNDQYDWELVKKMKVLGLLQ